MAAGYIDAVKDGKFYHVYGHGTPQEKWVYVRLASATGNALVAGSAARGGGSSATAPGSAAPPPPAAGVAAPSVPQAPPPPPTPFFTADDLMSANNFWTQWNTTFSDLDTALAKLKNDTAYQQKALDTSRVENKGANDWNAAARGLEHSSIKDGTTAKIETDYTRGTNQLNDNVRMANADAAQKKNYFETITKPQFQSALNQKAVENANAVSYNAPPPPGSPAAPAGAPAAAAPMAAAAGYRNIVKNGSFYHVYGYGTPGEKWTFIRKQA